MSAKNVRAVLPIEVYGDGDLRKRIAGLLERELKALGSTYTVEHRADQGIIIRGGWAGAYAEQIAAVSAIAALCDTLERALERIAGRGAKAAELVKGLDAACYRMDVKAIPAAGRR